MKLLLVFKFNRFPMILVSSATLQPTWVCRQRVLWHGFLYFHKKKKIVSAEPKNKSSFWWTHCKNPSNLNENPREKIFQFFHGWIFKSDLPWMNLQWRVLCSWNRLNLKTCYRNRFANLNFLCSCVLEFLKSFE